LASEREMITEQKKQLFQLLVSQKSPSEIKSFIAQLVTVMDKEDVSYVREQVEDYFADK